MTEIPDRLGQRFPKRLVIVDDQDLRHGTDPKLSASKGKTREFGRFKEIFWWNRSHCADCSRRSNDGGKLPSVLDSAGKSVRKVKSLK